MTAQSSNEALASKIRSMYGRRLTPSDYRELLRKQSTGEVAGYLKQRPGYASLLSDTNENLVHRGQLEATLRRQAFEEYTRMTYYIDPAERGFYEYIVTDMEIDEILSCIRFINSGQSGGYIFSLPEFFVKHASFDLYVLARVRNFFDLTDSLRGTPYQAVLRPFGADAQGRVDAIRIEMAFKHYYYEKIFSLIDGTYSGELRQRVIHSFGIDIDRINLMLILRLRRYFNASNDYIRSLLLPWFTRLNKKMLDRILEESDASGVLKAILNVYYGKKDVKNRSLDYLEKYGLQAKYDYYRKILMFADSTPELLTSYMQLKNVELGNLIHIIEGIHYALQPAEIGELLTGAEG